MKRTALLIISLVTLCLVLTGCGKLKVGDAVYSWEQYISEEQSS